MHQAQPAYIKILTHSLDQNKIIKTFKICYGMLDLDRFLEQFEMKAA